MYACWNRGWGKQSCAVGSGRGDSLRLAERGVMDFPTLIVRSVRAYVVPARLVRPSRRSRTNGTPAGRSVWARAKRALRARGVSFSENSPIGSRSVLPPQAPTPASASQGPNVRLPSDFNVPTPLRIDSLAAGTSPLPAPRARPAPQSDATRHRTTARYEKHTSQRRTQPGGAPLLDDRIHRHLSTHANTHGGPGDRSRRFPSAPACPRRQGTLQGRFSHVSELGALWGWYIKVAG